MERKRGMEERGEEGKGERDEGVEKWRDREERGIEK